MTANSSNLSPQLTMWRFWFALGAGLVLLVIYLSLADIHLPQVSSTIGDKINHLLAYGALMGWFGQLFVSVRSRAVVVVALLLLGIAMEIAQGMTGYRFLDKLDVLANALGVLCGLVALQLGADKILHWFERRVLHRS